MALPSKLPTHMKRTSHENCLGTFFETLIYIIGDIRSSIRLDCNISLLRLITTRLQMSMSEEEVDVWDDNGEGNLMTLFVLDEIPVAVSPMFMLKPANH